MPIASAVDGLCVCIASAAMDVEPIASAADGW